jgi:hypothetical protein
MAILASFSSMGGSALMAESALQGMASGSFLYLCFHEISDEKRNKLVPVWLQASLVLLGLTCMAILCIWL